MEFKLWNIKLYSIGGVLFVFLEILLYFRWSFGGLGIGEVIWKFYFLSNSFLKCMCVIYLYVFFNNMVEVIERIWYDMKFV